MLNIVELAVVVVNSGGKSDHLEPELGSLYIFFVFWFLGEEIGFF